MTTETLQKTDIYTKITNRIIEDMEQGQLTWRKPWSAEYMAQNVMRPLRWNDQPYTGVNILMLWATAAEKGFASPYWMTLNQANSMKAAVRKGEKGTIVVYADKLQKEEANEKGEMETKTIPYLKSYIVFNASQIDGLPDAYNQVSQKPPLNPEQKSESLEKFFAQTKAQISTGAKACYITSRDTIEMPPFESFYDATGYYATLAHELTHWTRHESRMNRDFGKFRFGNEAYAKEELVAELGSCFLAADLGIEPELRPDHAAYIQNWIEVLKDDKRFIFTAASHAQKAVEYIHKLQISDQ